MNIIEFESQLELYEILRDKSKDYRNKENEELKKHLSCLRAKHKHYIIVTPNEIFSLN